MKRLFPVFALTALAAATVATAQQSPQTSAQPPPSTSQSQTTPPSDTSSEASKADKQALMEDCLTQVQASNPQESKEDIRKFCEKAVNKSPPQG